MAVRTFTFVEGELIHQYDGTNSHDILPDPQGNVVGLLGADSGIEFDFEYWPYEEVPSAFSAVTPYRYIGAQGYYSDIYSRVYVVARHYRAPYGRWMTFDPAFMLSRDGYTYCSSSPTSCTDPSGLWKWGYQGEVPKVVKDGIWSGFTEWNDTTSLSEYYDCISNCEFRALGSDNVDGSSITNIIGAWQHNLDTPSFYFSYENCSDPNLCAWVRQGSNVIHLCKPTVLSKKCGKWICLIFHELIHLAGVPHNNSSDELFKCVGMIRDCQGIGPREVTDNFIEVK